LARTLHGPTEFRMNMLEIIDLSLGCKLFRVLEIIYYISYWCGAWWRGRFYCEWRLAEREVLPGIALEVEDYWSACA